MEMKVLILAIIQEGLVNWDSLIQVVEEHRYIVEVVLI